MTKIYLVPIGSNCSTTKIMENILNIKQERNPFEWNTCNSARKVVDLLKNNFNNFIKKEQILLQSSDNEFAFTNNHEMVFNHETQNISGKWTIDEKIRQEIIEKYERRIKRTLQKLKEAEKIIFFRFMPEYFYVPDENKHNFPKKDKENGQIIIDELKNVYNKKQVECYYINNIDKMNNFINYIQKLKQDNIFI
jgi:hypothetical protein